VPLEKIAAGKPSDPPKNGSVRYSSLFETSFHPNMIGPTAEQARPTIIFTCENKIQRQRAQKLVRNSKLLDQYPGFRLGESARPLRLTMSPQPLGSDGDATVKGERNLSE
jgi:hypothetical protein